MFRSDHVISHFDICLDEFVEEEENKVNDFWSSGEVFVITPVYADDPKQDKAQHKSEDKIFC
jgi:hypothetical protein